MTEINHHLRTIKEVLSKTYKVPFYQREYRWKRKQFEELFTDLQDEFLQHFDETHGRDQVAQYKSYFLGAILTTTDQQTSRKIIVDGQQRLTSLTLFFIYALKQRNLSAALKVTDFTSLIKTESFGTPVLNFESDHDRSKLINLLVENDGSEENSAFDFVDDADSGTKNIFERYNEIEDVLDDDIKNKYFSYFADWVAEKVILFEIVVPTEHDAHKVFVTMNDRGLNLTPAEMLKGFLLSKISNQIKHQEAHQLWQDRTRELKKIDHEEDSNFIRNWLRAKYAGSIRGKSVGEEKGDFENIGDSYHRWLHENRESIGLNTGDNYQSFVLDNYDRYSKIYLRLQKYACEFTKGYEAVYYNASKEISLQNMVILSSISLDDPDAVIDKKIDIVSKYIDFYTTARLINNKKNTYDNLRDLFFSLTVKVRDKDISTLRQTLRAHADELEFGVTTIENFTYEKAQTKNILHILARIAYYIEDGIEQTNSVGFPSYVDRKRSSRTYDIEHILCDDYNVFEQSSTSSENDFSSPLEYRRERNKLGGLILLPRSRNRSLKDKPYLNKLSKYMSENVLAQSLGKDFYENNPQVERFVSDSRLGFQSYENFNKAALNSRELLYIDIIKKIWDIDSILE
ncbi:DUF262 domain-containing protein [Aeromonas hydrophila]|uniref:DUF262 domain-containing protein n=1 Tax=Aeromonas hydrophila TaxID=644 RepID=UPI00140FBB42|nr:DUF262 domain-containing protein [Aeromonas hydrophila]NHT35063.1 DUF262 domain-containing protein [Aeromonas hydrophila]